MVWNWPQGARKTPSPSSRSARLNTGTAERAAGKQCSQGRVRAGREEWAPLSDLATEFLFLAKQQRTLLLPFTVCTLNMDKGSIGSRTGAHSETVRFFETVL